MKSTHSLTTDRPALDRSLATVAEVALTYPQAISVLNRLQIDYCCQGRKSFREACSKAGLDEIRVWQEIESTAPSLEPVHLENWDTLMLVDYILNHHHTYVRQSIPQLLELLDKICSVHGSDTPALFLVREEFQKLADELTSHLPKEEEVLFPAIQHLNKLSKFEISHHNFLSRLDAPIDVMEHDHDAAGELLKSIRAKTNQFTPPSFACPTFQITYKLLEEFETDLMQHVHIENNILFPKVKQIINEATK